MQQTQVMPSVSTSRTGMTQQTAGPVTTYPRGVGGPGMVSVAPNAAGQAVQVMTLQPQGQTSQSLSTATPPFYTTQPVSGALPQLPGPQQFAVTSGQLHPVGMYVVTSSNSTPLGPGCGPIQPSATSYYSHALDPSQAHVAHPTAAVYTVQTQQNPPQAAMQTTQPTGQPYMIAAPGPYAIQPQPPQQQQTQVITAMHHPHAYHAHAQPSGTLYIPTGAAGGAENFAAPVLAPSASAVAGAFRK